LADAREDVGERAPARPRVERLVGRDERKIAGARERDETLEIALLAPIEVALDLHEAVRHAEDPGEAVERGARGVAIAGGNRRRERTPRAARETDEPRRMRFEIVPARGRFALRRAQLHLRDETRKVLVALAVLHEQRQARAADERDLGADERLHP